MKPKQRKVIKNWIRDLRSGKYIQSSTPSQLKNDFGHCCLGVLCETLEIPSIQSNLYGRYAFGSMNDTAGLPDEAAKQIGVENQLPSIFGTSFSSLNDVGYKPAKQNGNDLIRERLSFDEIADLLDIALLEGEGITND